MRDHVAASAREVMADSAIEHEARAGNPPVR